MTLRGDEQDEHRDQGHHRGGHSLTKLDHGLCVTGHLAENAQTKSDSQLFRTSQTEQKSEK